MVLFMITHWSNYQSKASLTKWLPWQLTSSPISWPKLHPVSPPTRSRPWMLWDALLPLDSPMSGTFWQLASSLQDSSDFNKKSKTRSISTTHTSALAKMTIPRCFQFSERLTPPHSNLASEEYRHLRHEHPKLNHTIWATCRIVSPSNITFEPTFRTICHWF